jgi:hypothetical protein
MCEINKETVIDLILSIPYEKWISDKYSDNCIIRYYRCLREKVLEIFKDYDDKKNEYKKSKHSLKIKRDEFQKANEALYLFNRVLLFKLFNKNNNKKFDTCFFAINTFINKLQNQYIFDISCQIQQKNSKTSISIAYIALGFTVVFGIVSLLSSVYDWKYQKSDLPNKIECLFDSIKTLNEKIDQQNEIIEKYFLNQKQDSIANPKTTNKLK